MFNDLDWIEEDNYVLWIENYDQFLSNENPKELVDTLKLFNKTANEWKNVPNFKGEEEFREKADFRVILEKTEKAVRDVKSVE